MALLKQNKALGWLIFLYILILAYLIRIFEEIQVIYLLGLVIGIFLIFPFKNTFSKGVIGLSRLLLGALFIFSGTVKGIDPVGTMYRIEDYFIAFGTEWAMPLALPLSVLMNGWEFLLGVVLLFNIQLKIMRWPLVVTMAIFTLVTLNDALYSPVPDCGCFGDALIISNWQTFYKNLVIDALLLIVFLTAGKSKEWFRLPAGIGILGIFAIGFLYFQVYNIRHLPVLDFREWKVGNKLSHENPLPKKYYLIYQDKETGEKEEYVSPDYPYDDSVWVASHEFVDQRIVDPNPPLHSLNLEDMYGTDQTANVVENPDLQYLMIAEDLDKSNLEGMESIRDFIRYCDESGIAFGLVTSSLPEQVQAFLLEQELDVEYYFADDISLKAMIRSNPGLILLNDAVVIDKWHYNDWPESPDSKASEY